MDGIGPTGGWETYWMEVDVKRRRERARWAAPMPADIVRRMVGAHPSMRAAARCAARRHDASVDARHRATSRVELRRTSRPVVRRAEGRRGSGRSAIVDEQARSRSGFSFPISTASCAARRWSPAKRCARWRAAVTITTTMLAKDTSHRTVFPVFTAGGGFGMTEMEGAADVLMVPDPTTFRVLPWAPSTGWLLCDLYFADGRPVPFATRNLYRDGARRSWRRAATISSPASKSNSTSSSWKTPKLAPGACRPAGRAAAMSACCRMAISISPSSATTRWSRCWRSSARDVLALGLPLRSVEVEFGPSQCEFTFAPAARP